MANKLIDKIMFRRNRYSYEIYILDKLNRAVGIYNEIFIENKLEQIGYNTEMKKVASKTTMNVLTTNSYSS